MHKVTLLELVTLSKELKFCRENVHSAFGHEDTPNDFWGSACIAIDIAHTIEPVPVELISALHEFYRHVKEKAPFYAIHCMEFTVKQAFIQYAVMLVETDPGIYADKLPEPEITFTPFPSFSKN